MDPFFTFHWNGWMTFLSDSPTRVSVEGSSDTRMMDLPTKTQLSIVRNV